MSLLKWVLKRPFTSVELHAMAAHHLGRPPLPDTMYEAAAGMVGKKGVSLLDHWRSAFSIQLDEIAGEKTWLAQRAMLLRIVLVEEGWSDVFASTNDITSVDVWAHLVSENETSIQFPKENWKSMLLQRYILALLSTACLMELGIKNCSIDSLKQLELRLHSEYYREILKLDLQIGQMVREMIVNYDDEDAINVADLKDDIINSIIAEQYRVLALIAEQIAKT